MKKLYRDPKQGKITGLCAGVGEYLEIDPTVIRLLMLFIILITWIVPGTLAYFLASLVVPAKGNNHA